MPSFERMRVRLEFGTNSTVIPQIRISYSQRTKPAARRVTQYTVAAEIELYTPPDALWFPVVDAVRQRVFLQRRWGTWTDAELGQAWRALTSTVGAWD
jgi:hypothetical protein